MQDRTNFPNDSNLLITSDESSEDIFKQSMLKLNVCGQMHCNYSKFANNYNLANVSSFGGRPSNTSSSKPKILEIQSKTIVSIGESICIRVNFSSNCLSKTSIVWSKKGKQIYESDRILITNEEQMSALIIKRVMDCDNGVYEIEVSNELGSDHVHTSLEVKGPPEPPPKPSILLTDSSVRLLWTPPAYDGGSRLTGYKIEMKCDQNDWKLLSDECIANSFTVNNLSANSLYLFRVSAINEYGISQSSQPSELIKLIVDNSDNQINNLENDVNQQNVVIEKTVNFYDIFTIKEEVGRGRFGLCKRVIELSSNKEKAAKVIRCLRAKDKEEVYREIHIMNQLRHKHILQLDSAYELPKEMILITEYISGGELFERIVADDYILTEFECILFMRQICEAVSYMHLNNIMHLDLKPENILCKTKTSHEIKIIDFGLARTFNPDETLKIMFGTPEFVAPEIVNYEAVTPASDMWSIGVICYVLLSGLSPFMDETDAKTLCNVTQAEYDFEDEAFDRISEEAKHFVEQLLVKNPEKRLTANECLSNSWLQTQPSKHIQIPTDKLKRFLIRQKWQKTGTAIRALGRIANLGLHKSFGREEQQSSHSSLK